MQSVSQCKQLLQTPSY